MTPTGAAPASGDYYSSKGETPGRWMGRGLASLGAPIGRDAADPLVARLWGVAEGSEVSEAQMKALFGEGLHPNADAITAHLSGHGAAGARRGRRRPAGPPVSAQRQRKRVHPPAARAPTATTTPPSVSTPRAALEPEVRAEIRTALARDMFTETYDRRTR